uniref:Uncharacterized protein n=1 Tax=Chenopodium quinoa TaxID=63459 RepID=A0A803M4H6_CHEQI
MVGAFQMPRITLVALSTSSSSSTSGNSDDFLPRKSQSNSANSHLLSIPKPSLIVRTQSNVRIEKKRKPEPACVVCGGSGRVDCNQCHGRGRTNYTDLIMLPKGEWPNWCRTCGGSGLGYCSRCLGTGEYRDVMGFHFLKRESNHPPKPTKHQTDGNAEHLTAADLHFSHTPSEAE